MSPSWPFKMPLFRGRFLRQRVLTMSSPKPNVKTDREEGCKPEKGTGQGKNFFWCPHTENLFPSAAYHQSLLSWFSLLVSLSASHSKTLFIYFIRASFYHLSTELLGALFTAKSSSFFFVPFFFFFFPFLFFLGGVFFFFLVILLSVWFLCLFFFAPGGISFLAPPQAPLHYPSPVMTGCAWGEWLRVGGCF